MTKLISKYSIFFLLITIMACDSGARPDLEDFVEKYIQSIYHGTEFYKQFTHKNNLAVIVNSKNKMTEKFNIKKWDTFGPGNYEYIVEFSNGVIAGVSVYESNGVVKDASMLIDVNQFN